MRVAPLVSRSVLALMIGAMAFTAQPGLAQKKDKKKDKEAAAAPAAPAITPSKGYLPEAKKVQAAYQAKDPVALEAALAAADAVATTPQDKFLQSQFRLQLGLLKKDQTLQASALDGMLDSGLTPAADVARFNYFSGQFAFNQKDYAKAITRLLAAQAAGAKDANIPELLVVSYLQTNQPEKVLETANTAIAAQRGAARAPRTYFTHRPRRSCKRLVAVRNCSICWRYASRTIRIPKSGAIRCSSVCRALTRISPSTRCG
ncbi:MAG: hypothetical protein HC788_02235 [Sphingopyxis sp.]|nr:hypothetical protein [Sphingopyxis sp.]